MTKKEMEKVRDEIFQKIWHSYQEIVKNRIGPNKPSDESIWIIENVVDITIKELRSRRLLKYHDHKPILKKLAGSKPSAGKKTKKGISRKIITKV